ncbi:MAG: hypothetical protein P4L22_01015 [Candidatus Babeliales bacterium]|nr:hypothetical protein [Candidatus Babeliales bacterium]
MKIFKLSIAIFSILTSSYVYPMHKNVAKHKTQVNVDLAGIEYFTNKTFNVLIQEQKVIGKPYILVEAHVNKKKYYYDAHEFNKYHYGYPISKHDLIDRQTGKQITEINYYICHKLKDGFKKFKQFNNCSSEEYYINCTDPKLHYTLGSSPHYGFGPDSSRYQFCLLAAQQNSDYDSKSKALVMLITLSSNNSNPITQILQTTDIDLLSKEAKIKVNYFYITTNYDKQDTQKKLARLKFCYDQEEFPNIKREVTKDFANLLYLVLDNSPKNIQLKINYLTEIYEETDDLINKTNYALRISILYCKLQMYSTAYLKFLNPIFDAEPIVDIDKLNHDDLLTAKFYYAQIYFDGEIVEKNLELSEKLFKQIYTQFDELNSEVKTLAAIYLGTINYKKEMFKKSFEYFQYTYSEDSNTQTKAIACAFIGKIGFYSNNDVINDENTTHWLQEALTYETLPATLKSEVEELLNQSIIRDEERRQDEERQEKLDLLIAQKKQLKLKALKPISFVPKPIIKPAKKQSICPEGCEIQ